MEEVWAEKTRTDTVIVNLDSGVDLTHPDLAPNLWKNTREISGNGLDDDGNGYVDDINGWNFIDNNNDVSDHFGHGTKIAGIGAVGNNTTGIAGVNWSCQMMTLKVSRDEDGLVTGNLLKAIQYASSTLKKQGTRGVFNASFAGLGRSQLIADAIRDSGMLFVASTGNYGYTDPNSIYYPAGLSSEMPNVLSVTASTYDSDDRLRERSLLAWCGLCRPRRMDSHHRTRWRVHPYRRDFPVSASRDPCLGDDVGPNKRRYPRRACQASQVSGRMPGAESYQDKRTGECEQSLSRSVQPQPTTHSNCHHHFLLDWRGGNAGAERLHFGSRRRFVDRYVGLRRWHAGGRCSSQPSVSGNGDVPRCGNGKRRDRLSDSVDERDGD